MYGKLHKEIDNTIELYKVGDTLYRVGSTKDKDKEFIITKVTIIEIKHLPHCVYIDDQKRSYFNRNVLSSLFKTEEEAVQEAKKRKNIIEKRKRLKEYERKLNEELGIEDHYIIK